MKKNVLVLLAISTLMSCSGQSLDLSKIDFSKPAADYLGKLELSDVKTQKGHWELTGTDEDHEPVLKDNGETSKVYSFNDASDMAKLNFSGHAFDNAVGGRIVEYKGKVVFYSFYLDKRKTFDVLNNLKELLGKPSGYVQDTISVSNTAVSLLKKGLPAADVKVVKDEMGEQFVYPEQFIWKKDNVIYQYTLVDGTTVIEGKIVAIEVNAFKDRIIFGYHLPDENPVLSPYIK